MMGLIIWLIVGGIIGWLASMIMKTDAQQGVLLNVIVGIIGAFIGGWLIAPLIGGSTSSSGGFDIMGFIAALIGPLIRLAIVNLFRPGRVPLQPTTSARSPRARRFHRAFFFLRFSTHHARCSWL